MDILTRFLNYVRIPTTSLDSSNLTPSTEAQKDLAKLLVTELKDLGLDVYYDQEKAYVYGVLKGDIEAPRVGFISHLDTSQDAKGDNIRPRIISNYQGSDVYLRQGVLKNEDYPDLKKHVGKTLITTDGTTLLGADDKAGIAEIMTMLEYFSHNDVSHGDIVVAFTPDEEIGLGTEYFDLRNFPADFAYTVDGSSLGEISYENFNAAKASIEITGTVMHIGSAKDKLVNALVVAHQLEAMLPDEKPENTSGYEGFYYLKKLMGDASSAKMEYLIRDFDSVDFIKRKLRLEIIVSKLNKKYNDCIKLNIKDQYYNMNDVIEYNRFLVNVPIQVMKDLQVEALELPIRGGTDGANLTDMGLPCPNLGTGGHNFHSTHEYICLEDMEKVSEILIGIVLSFSKGENIYKLRR